LRGESGTMTGQDTTSDRFGFTETHWPLIVDAIESPQARSRLFARYQRPARAYLLMLTRNSDEADEVLQSFFVAELTRLAQQGKGGVLRGADPTKGRFRDYLKKSLHNHWLGIIRNKPGPSILVVPEDDDAWDRLELPGQKNAEQSFYRSWIEQLIADALRKVEAICRDRGQQEHLDLFLAHYLPADGADDSWEDIASRFNLPDGKTARNRAQTVAAHFRAALGELLAEEDREADLAEEIRDLLAMLGEGDD
jgi:DNA-directed RNA polymerase specialized sigma24 family protein